MSAEFEFDFAASLHEHLSQHEMNEYLDLLQDVLEMKNTNKSCYYKICQYFSEMATGTSLKIVIATIDKPLKSALRSLQKRHIMYASSSAFLFAVHNWRVARCLVAQADKILIVVRKLLEYKLMDLSAIGIQVAYCLASVGDKDFYMKMFEKNIIQNLWPAFMNLGGESTRSNVCKYIVWIYLLLAELGGTECCQKLRDMKADTKAAILSLDLHNKPEEARTNSEEFFIDATGDLITALKGGQTSYFTNYTKRQRLSAYMLYENEFVWTELPVFCSNPSCAKEENIERKEKYQVCSRCRLSCYCSRACQSKHWMEYGHKKMCKKIDDALG